VWLPLGLLTIYLIGLFAFCGFVGPLELTAAVFLSLLSFISPSAGLGLLLAGLPLASYFTDSPGYYFSGPDLFVAFALLGVICRFSVGKRLDPTKMRGLALALGIIGFFAITPVFRFANLGTWHFADLARTFWLHLYHGDQVSPFAFIYRSWIWALGAVLFFAIRAERGICLEPATPEVPEEGSSSSIVRSSGEGAAIREKIAGATDGFDWIYWGLLTAGVVVAVASICDLIGNKRVLTVFGYSVLFGDRNTYAAFWLVELGLLAYVWGRPRRLQRIPAYVLFIPFSLLLFASVSLSGMVSWVVVLGLSVFAFANTRVLEVFRLSFYRRHWGKLLIGLLLLYLLSFALPLVYAPSDPIPFEGAIGERVRTITRVGLLDYLLDSGRLSLWAVGREMIRDVPIFGIGIGRFYLVSSQYVDRVQVIPGWTKPPENAHNYFLQVAAETGLVGLLLFLGFLLWLFIRRWDLRGASKNTAAGIAIFGILLMSLTGHPLLVQSFFFMSCAVAALVAGPIDQDRRFWIGIWGLKWARKLLVLMAGTLLVLYVFHVKSIWNELPPNFEWGIYGVEGQGEEKFSWTRGLALKTVERDQLSTVFVSALSGPTPVAVQIYGNNYQLGEVQLKDDGWHAVSLAMKPELPSRFVLAIKPSRTWIPAKSGHGPDYRELGVAVRFK